ncbi:MAG TPA: protein kinase [Anaerolineales bacterium]|nr:protein kinase [Anaerolineales bacterium]
MTDDPLLGHQLGNFRLERVLGRGGMGQVYYGWDIKLQRPVAVKVIDFRFRNNPAYAKRFVREAQAVASWRHENIAQVHHADEQGDLYYFAMEYIDGLDLGELLSHYTARGELMPQVDVLRIGWALASALDYAHTKDVVHRDVKPSNVIIARDDRVVLTDFGLAMDLQQGSVGEVFGSAHYIAPEQARRSSDAIAQSDLYSLGIMLYEMLTGLVPFDDPSPTAVALQHITQPPPAPRSINPNLNDETENILLKALSKSPQDRYQTGHELITALEDAIQNSFTTTNPAPLPPLPAGVRPRSSQPAISQMKAHEVIASQMSIAHPSPVRPLQTKPPSREAPPARQQPKRPRQISWMALGGCLLILVVVALTSIWFAGPLGNLFQANAPFADGTMVSPSSSAEDAFAESPNGLTSPIPATLALEPQITAGPPTVKYPDGKRFMLFYDDHSLYFFNLSESSVPINWVAFERLSDSDQPLNRFNGTRWAEFYATSLPNRCMALRILGSPSYLDPPECGNNNFLSLRTPTRDDATVFWTTQEGSHQFRVLWREGGQDEEVARCEIGAGVCEVFLP